MNTKQRNIAARRDAALLQSVEELPLSPKLLRQQRLHLVSIKRRDTTAIICGDPAPGYSAFDRALGCYAVAIAEAR